MEDAELIPIVDDEDKIIRYTTKKQAHAEGLLHRSSHIFVFDRESRIYVPQIAAGKFVGLYSVSVSGHVQKDESYLDAALRELEEETHIRSDVLEFITKIPPTQTSLEFATLYCLKTDQPIIPNHETLDYFFASMAELNTFFNFSPDKFTPVFNQLYPLILGHC